MSEMLTVQEQRSIFSVYSQGVCACSQETNT